MKIPVYPGAKLVDHDVGHSQQGDDFNNLSRYTTDVWKLSVTASPDEVMAFYADKLPEAKREEQDDDDPRQALRWYPQGAKVNEVDVSIVGGILTIAENSKD